MRSISPASIPAHASALAAATCASSMPVTCERRRSLMPVREVIHSSLVSINKARSALLRTDGGMHFPQPVIAAYLMSIPESPLSALFVPVDHYRPETLPFARVRRCGSCVMWSARFRVRCARTRQSAPGERVDDDVQPDDAE